MPTSLLCIIIWRVPFDFPQILFNCFSTEVMKDKSIGKEIYHSVVLTKVFEMHGVMRKFLYETPIDVQDKIYLDGVFLPKQKAFSQKNISKMRLVNEGSYLDGDDSTLVELQQKFGLNTRWDDQLNIVWEKVDEKEKVDAKEATTQVKQRTKKKKDPPSSKVVLVQQHPSTTLITP